MSDKENTFPDTEHFTETLAGHVANTLLSTKARESEEITDKGLYDAVEHALQRHRASKNSLLFDVAIASAYVVFESGFPNIDHAVDGVGVRHAQYGTVLSLLQSDFACNSHSSGFSAHQSWHFFVVTPSCVVCNSVFNIKGHEVIFVPSYWGHDSLEIVTKQDSMSVLVSEVDDDIRKKTTCSYTLQIKLVNPNLMDVKCRLMPYCKYVSMQRVCVSVIYFV